jgi:hypothetical protein
VISEHPVPEFLTVDVSELASLVRSHLGAEWQPFIQEHGKQGESESIIFVREKGDAVGMMIADYEHGELDVVRMEAVALLIFRAKSSTF